MKMIIKILTISTTIFLFTQCKKSGSTSNAYFYSNTNYTEETLYLYLDDKYQGELPKLKTEPSANSDSLKQKMLFVSLNCGKYKIVAKDNQGNIKSSGTLKFKTNSLNSSSQMGGQSASSSNQCLIVGLWY